MLSDHNVFVSRTVDWQTTVASALATLAWWLVSSQYVPRLDEIYKEEGERMKKAMIIWSLVIPVLEMTIILTQNS